MSWKKILKMPKLSMGKSKELKELMQDGEWRTIQEILDALDLDSSYMNRIRGKLDKSTPGGGPPQYNKRDKDGKWGRVSEYKRFGS